MKLIRTSAETELTINNLIKWLSVWNKEYLPLLNENQGYILNTRGDVLPFAKKIVTISTAATLGQGIEFKETDSSDDNVVTPFNKKQKQTLSVIKDLFRKQTIKARDASVIKQGSSFGVGYELCYMSDDDIPVPKVKELSPLSAFVVFDDTVEDNSLFGVYFNEYQKGKKNKELEVYVYDEKFKYTLRLPSGLSGLEKVDVSPLLKEMLYCPFRIAESENIPLNYTKVLNDELFLDYLTSIEPHNIGRMPITMYFNNEELQGDFEQVKPTIDARNKISELAMDDAETISGNYLVFKGAELVGQTETEKVRTITAIGRTKVIEIDEGEDVNILTKQETFSMISVFGKDLERKIFDLSMVIDFSSEEFSGNITGVALRLKLFPFKRLVSSKDYFVERLYKRRIKMYAHALQLREPDKFEMFDVGDIDITIPRQWEENILEIAQVIASLANLGIFSDKYLIEKMPDGEYEVEIKQRQAEQKEKAKNHKVDPNNYYADSLQRLLRG